jgi:DNA-directed RNA polymerase specialized sigma24 family protein
MPVNLPAETLRSIFTAQLTTPEGATCKKYLHQLDVGGQDWGTFFAVICPIAKRVAQAKEFRAIIPEVLDLEDAVSEFQWRVYEYWIKDYLQGELQQQVPHPLATFLHDRFRDYLCTRKETTQNRRRLVDGQARILPPNGNYYTRSTGAKSVIVAQANGHQPVEFFTDTETKGVRYSLWPSALPTPEFAALFQEFIDRLYEPLYTVARLLVEGLTNQEVATAMGTHESTVSRQRHRLAAMWYEGEEGGESL